MKHGHFLLERSFTLVTIATVFPSQGPKDLRSSVLYQSCCGRHETPSDELLGKKYFSESIRDAPHNKQQSETPNVCSCQGFGVVAGSCAQRAPWHRDIQSRTLAKLSLPLSRFRVPSLQLCCQNRFFLARSRVTWRCLFLSKFSPSKPVL